MGKLELFCWPLKAALVEKEMATPTPVILPGKHHGQRSLAGYSPWDHKSQTRLSD